MSDVSELLVPPHSETPVLLCSGALPLARLTLCEADFPWLEYDFEALDGWERLGTAKEVFSEPARGNFDVVDAKVKAIESLDLWLTSDDGSIRVGDFLMHVRGEKVRIRSYRRGQLWSPGDGDSVPKRWVEVGRALSADAGARVQCPVCAADFLKVTERHAGLGDQVVLFLKCENCGASNSLMVGVPLLRDPASDES